MARCAAQAAGSWYDTRGAVAAHTCTEHQALAGELLRARMPRGRKLDRWLPAGIKWTPARHAAPPRKAYQLTVGCHWIHHITLDKVTTRPRTGTVYPRCSAGKRACPPEDCGGPLAL